MLKKLRLKRKLLILSIPILIVVSAAALYTNGIFYYSEFKSSVQVQYKFDDSAKLKELLDTTSKQSNVASIDRVNNVIDFENSSLDSEKNNIQALTANYTGVTFTVKEVSSLQKGNLTAIIAGLYLLFIAGAAIHFYFVSGKGGDLKIIIGSYIILLKYLSITAFLSLGLLSLISRSYKITSFDLLLVLIAAIASYLIYYISTINIFELRSFQSVGLILKEFINKNAKVILFPVIVLLAITSFGLGTSFVIHALLLLAFILISLFEFYWTGFILEEWKNLDNSFYSRIQLIRSLSLRRPASNLPIVEKPRKKDHAKGQAGKKKKKKK